MHRMIMLSNVYRESSLSQDEAAAIDPDDKLLWRYPRHRVEGEELRDAMLLTSGKLNPKMGGPGVRPELPPGVNTCRICRLASRKGRSGGEPPQRLRVREARADVSDVDAFDAPNAQDSCPRRFSTVVPVAGADPDER